MCLCGCSQQALHGWCYHPPSKHWNNVTELQKKSGKLLESLPRQGIYPFITVCSNTRNLNQINSKPFRTCLFTSHHSCLVHFKWRSLFPWIVPVQAGVKAHLNSGLDQTSRLWFTWMCCGCSSACTQPVHLLQRWFERSSSQSEHQWSVADRWSKSGIHYFAGGWTFWEIPCFDPEGM